MYEDDTNSRTKAKRRKQYLTAADCEIPSRSLRRYQAKYREQQIHHQQAQPHSFGPQVAEGEDPHPPAAPPGGPPEGPYQYPLRDEGSLLAQPHSFGPQVAEGEDPHPPAAPPGGPPEGPYQYPFRDEGSLLAQPHSFGPQVAEGEDPHPPAAPPGGPPEGPYQYPFRDEGVVYRPPVGHPALLAAIQDNYQDVISSPAAVSRGEALLMALSLVRQDNLTKTARNHIVFLINSLFNSPILPRNEYHLDKLLASDVGFDRHFYCATCQKCFGRLNHKEIGSFVCTNEQCQTVNVVSDLCRAKYFVIFDIAQTIQFLLNDENIAASLMDPSQAIENAVPGVLRDVYDGVMYQRFAEFSQTVGADKVISFQFCTDGSPLFKSSSCSIWPITLIINELPLQLRAKHMLVGGLWFGSKKPPMDLFLEPFVEHIAALGTNGFEAKVGNNVLKMKAFAVACCVDSGARGSVQGLKSHSAYSSCNWCLHSGKSVDGKVKFPSVDPIPERRTHQSIVEQGENALQGTGEEGVKAVSPLINLPFFDLVNGMIVEYMHNVNLGVARYFMKCWFSDEGTEYYLGSDAIKYELNGRIAKLNPPIEVRRMPRSMEERAFWKAKEWENWLLFFSIPVLEGILPKKFLDHWAFIVQAMHLLLRDTLTHEQIELADKLISHFCVMAEYLYKKPSIMTFNMHLLTHLSENVLRWGPLWAVSAYVFESGNGELQNMLHTHRGIPHQICRVLSEQQALHLLKQYCSTPITMNYFKSLKPKQIAKKATSVGNAHFIGQGEAFYANEEEAYFCEANQQDAKQCTVYKKLILEGCVYTTEKQGRRTSNSAVQLKDNRFFLIQKIIHNQSDDTGFILGNEIRTSHCSQVNLSDRIDCLLVVDYIKEDLDFISINLFHRVAVRVRPHQAEYLVTVPNIFSAT